MGVPVRPHARHEHRGCVDGADYGTGGVGAGGGVQRSGIQMRVIGMSIFLLSLVLCGPQIAPSVEAAGGLQAIDVNRFNDCSRPTAKIEHDFGQWFVTAVRRSDNVRVRVGPYSTEESAQALLDALNLPCPILEYDPAYDGPPLPSDGPTAAERYREWIERFDRHAAGRWNNIRTYSVQCDDEPVPGDDWFRQFRNFRPSNQESAVQCDKE